MAESVGPQDDGPKVDQRIDKWLWHARVTKTRTLATKLVMGGAVRINRERITSPSKAVRHDDVLTITLERRILVYRVADFAQRRGPFAQASQLYEDLSPPAQASQEPELASTGPEKRPDQRARKALSELRGKSV